MKKEIMQGTMPGAHRRGRPRTAWMDNIETWSGLSVEESIRMTEDRDKCALVMSPGMLRRDISRRFIIIIIKWRKYVHAVANPRIEDG